MLARISQIIFRLNYAAFLPATVKIDLRKPSFDCIAADASPTGSKYIDTGNFRTVRRLETMHLCRFAQKEPRGTDIAKS